ncbi:crossover junction endonuclease EME1 isoform X1 [Spea bombifrons]|uniref:crossover junction endonuclease EME1 isoform X1 n=1 Tax=Spea bombifrons TaxID=233779 RepID=UPI00234A9E46|nr:crossover junction endonuclease EME1 isoform X1 [Spea bombifrons]
MVLSSDSEGEAYKANLCSLTDAASHVIQPQNPPANVPSGTLSKKRKKTLDNVTVHVDPGLLQDGHGGEVLSALQAQELLCVIEPQAVTRSITWTRAGGPVQGEEEEETVVLIPAEEFVALVQSFKKDPQGCSSDEISWAFFTRLTVGKRLTMPTMVVMEMEKYFRAHTHKKKRVKQGNLEVLPLLTKVDMEEVIIELQLQLGLHVWFMETWKEFADFVCMFSKAMAEAPTKRQQKDSFSFYLDGEWAGGVRVERCGKGLLDVWKRQIQQLNRVSVEIASAVVAAYPSPQLLIQAYNQCGTEAERNNLLSDILVRRGEGVTSTSRRIGLEMSKRICQELTSLDPDLLLDLS